MAIGDLIAILDSKQVSVAGDGNTPHTCLVSDNIYATVYENGAGVTKLDTRQINKTTGAIGASIGNKVLTGATFTNNVYALLTQIRV